MIPHELAQANIENRLMVCKLEGRKWDILLHAHYSPDCAPSDHYLFLSMKSALQYQHFKNHEEIKKLLEK